MRRKRREKMILFKNEYTSDKDAYIALTKAFFISLSPVRAALNYILSAALIGFGIYNLIIAQYTWGVVMTACGALLVLLTAGYPFLMGRSIHKYAADYQPFDMWVEFKEDSFRCSYCQNNNEYSDISAIKESEDYFFILIKGGHAVLKKGCFTVGDENGFASFISEKTSLKIRAAK